MITKPYNYNLNPEPTMLKIISATRYNQEDFYNKSPLGVSLRRMEFDEYLNDIPPSRLYIGTKFWLDRFYVEANATIQQKKNNPGPAEVGIPGYERVGLKAGYYIGSSFQIYLMLDNILNTTYTARPDPDAVEEPGRNLVVGLNFSF